jgi:lipopolysaccharide/colanic/teichoic acid biosynthesis glycosyltransferase
VLSARSLLVVLASRALIALLIRWSSPGPVFYRQERMGLDGKAFWVYKFRSMPVDAEDTTGPSGRATTTRGARRRPLAARSTSTSCRSSGTC